MIVVVMVERMETHEDAQSQEQYGADIPEPFLERVQFVSQIADADSTVTYQPRYQHDGQSCAQTEHNG